MSGKGCTPPAWHGVRRVIHAADTAGLVAAGLYAGVIIWAAADRSGRLRAANKRIATRMNRYAVKIAGTRFGYPYFHLGALRHVGRRSGTAYVTPIGTHEFGDGFVLPLMDGPNTDWCRNVLAAGECTLKVGGHEYRLDHPEVIADKRVAGAWGPFSLPVLEASGVNQFLWLHRATNGAAHHAA